MQDLSQKVRHLSLACRCGEAAYGPCVQHCETYDEPADSQLAADHDIQDAEEHRMDCSQVLEGRSKLAAADTVQVVAA